jgi:hypothetical protein
MKNRLQEGRGGRMANSEKAILNLMLETMG